MAAVIAPIALIATGLGSLVGGGMSLYAGIKKKEVAEAEAGYIEKLGKTEEKEFREAGEEFKREQKAALGASGAVMGEGSPLQLQHETLRKIEEDAMKIRREFKYRAKQTRRSGEVGLAQGIAGMGSSFLTGITGTYKFGKGEGWW